MSTANRAAPVLLATGIVAAIGAGKLPPMLPAIRAELAIDLVSASLLISVFMIGSALTGLFAGALADRFGHRRSMCAGLLAYATGSLASLVATDFAPLLAARALESLGFIVTVLCGPSLLRRHLAPASLGRWLGFWATYMPVGFALGLVLAPAFADLGSWRIAWAAHAALLLLAWWIVRRTIPADAAVQPASATRLVPLMRRTTGALGPWLLALSFGFYAGQYLSIVAFLPSIYQQAGIGALAAGGLTALVAVINVGGNVSAGLLAGRGVAPSTCIAIAAVSTALGAWLVFGAGLGFSARYLAVLATSLVMGLIPGALFVSAPRFAPDASTVATTVGFMQQGSGVGQVLLPPLVASVRTATGDWSSTWIVLATVAGVNLVLAFVMAREARRHAAAG